MTSQSCLCHFKYFNPAAARQMLELLTGHNKSLAGLFSGVEPVMSHELKTDSHSF